jgi:hypothetical protein
MINTATHLQEIRTLRSQVNIMYQAVAAPIQMPGKVTGNMAIKMAYEQAGREEYANRFKRVLDDLDKQERDVLAKIAEESQ